MSLNFSYTKCIENGTLTREEMVTEAEDWTPLCFSMPWLLSGIHMHTVTEDNVKEVWRRINIYQELNGGFCWVSDGRAGHGYDYLVTEEEVHKVIGMTTNVDNWTKAKFASYVKKQNTLKEKSA